MDDMDTNNSISSLEQELIVRRFIGLATNVVRARIGGGALMDLAIKRMTGIGNEVYGDKSFRRSEGELLAEVDDELADALVYASILLWRRLDGER